MAEAARLDDLADLLPPPVEAEAGGGDNVNADDNVNGGTRRSGTTIVYLRRTRSIGSFPVRRAQRRSQWRCGRPHDGLDRRRACPAYS